MLVLSRKESERIRIGDSIVITVVRLTRDRVRLGIEAPADVLVLRDELEKDENAHGASSSCEEELSVSEGNRRYVEMAPRGDFAPRGEVNPRVRARRPLRSRDAEAPETRSMSIAVEEDRDYDEQPVRRMPSSRTYFRWPENDE